MKERYIVLTEEFAQSMEGAMAGNVLFNARQTTAGVWVCAEESAVDFPAQFEPLKPFEIVELSIDDFPNPLG